MTVIRVDCTLAFARVFGTDYARSRCILEVILLIISEVYLEYSIADLYDPCLPVSSVPA